MRLFIAIQFEQTMLDALTSAQKAMQEAGIRGRYSRIENLHLTLAFIGEYSDADAVLEAMEQVRFAPFTLTLGGYVGNFGDILWAGLEKSEPLEKAASSLRHALADAGIPFDKKRFSPHVTLLRDAHTERGLPLRFSGVRVGKRSMTVQSISLMRSDRGKSGMVYTEVGRIAARS